MRSYDRAQPLVVIHVPKAAGVSTKEVFRRWFPGALYEHYLNEKTGALPRKYDLRALHTPERPAVVFGHFNRPRGFGVEAYYPDARQFVTILRDPFELAISGYFYTRRVGARWKDRSRVPGADVRAYLRQTPPNMLNQFPRTVTKENFRELIEEYFIEIGVVERLEESMRRIAAKLSMPFEPGWLPHLNTTARDQPYAEDLRLEYAERNPLEFAVYDYVVSRLGA